MENHPVYTTGVITGFTEQGRGSKYDGDPSNNDLVHYSPQILSFIFVYYLYLFKSKTNENFAFG